MTTAQPRQRTTVQILVPVRVVPMLRERVSIARAYGEGGQQQRGRGVRGYQEAAPERVSAVASLLGGRRGGLTMWARAWTWAYGAKAAASRTYGEGSQAEAGRVVSGHQDAAQERLLVGDEMLDGR